MRVEEGPNGALQLRHAAMDTTANLFGGQFREPTLHQVQSRAVGGREVHVKPGTFGEPSPDERGFVRSIVIHDDVDFPIGRHAGIDAIQKLIVLPEFDESEAAGISFGAISRQTMKV